MRHPDDTLPTPLYVKAAGESPESADPVESVAHVLASNGLFRWRSNELFTSCVKAPGYPSGLAEQKTFFSPRYPKLDRRMLEVAVGFFDRVYAVHGAESVLLMVWDRTRRRLGLVVPAQTATVSYDWWGRPSPIGVKYQVPANLPADWIILGDLHCHGDSWAYASMIDQNDESHRPGLHIVVGRIKSEPPEFHVEAVVDGTRFKLQPQDVMEGYRRRRCGIPARWLDRVQVESWGSRSRNKGGRSDGGGSAYGGQDDRGYYGGGWSSGGGSACGGQDRYGYGGDGHYGQSQYRDYGHYTVSGMQSGSLAQVSNPEPAKPAQADRAAHVDQAAKNDDLPIQSTRRQLPPPPQGRQGKSEPRP